MIGSSKRGAQEWAFSPFKKPLDAREKEEAVEDLALWSRRSWKNVMTTD